jgi:hypothetical protein
MRRRTQLNIPLYEGQDDDLLAWWASLAQGPHGAKVVELKAALRRGLTSTEQPAQVQAPTQPAALDLAAIRQVVEAAVTSGIAEALARLGSSQQLPTLPPQHMENHDHTTDLLAELGTALLLD